MGKKLARTVVAAGAGCALAVAGLITAPAALAATVSVPCDPAALATDMARASSGDTLSLAPGCVYPLAAGLPEITSTLTINGNGATLDASPPPNAGPFAITIMVISTGGDVTLNSLNFAHAGDGAIVAKNGVSELAVNGGTFSQNTAADGGAINIDENATVKVRGATFTSNRATDSGGAIYDFGLNDLTIAGSTFSGNYAESGGAIFNNNRDGEGLTNVTIRGNTAAGDGGGVYDIYAALSLNNSRISRNHAGGQGGGIYQKYLNTDLYGVYAASTTVSGNTAAEGGGIYVLSSEASVTGGSVTGNSASGNGGGIANHGPGDLGGDVLLTNTAVSLNHAGGDGGGIYNEGALAATGSMIVSNSAAAGGGIFDAGTWPPTASLSGSTVSSNTPDNCEPPGSISGCTG